jgi:hypothetical protein
MQLSKNATRSAVEGWTDDLWDCAVGHGQGIRQNVGILIDGCAVTSDCNHVEREFYGKLSVEAGSPANRIPVSLGWVTDGHDDLHDGQCRWRWGTARIPRGDRTVYGYIFPTGSPDCPTLRVVLGTNPEGLQLFETLLLRAKQIGSQHVSLHVWLEPLEEGSPSDTVFNRLMTVSRFIFDQRIVL